MLGSGSKGNAVVVDADGTRLLIDAGFSPRTLQRRLHVAGIAPESIHSLLITHEHSDHVCGAAAAAEKWGWCVRASRGTVAACPSLAAASPETFAAGETVSVGSLDVRTVSSSHDASDPVAMVVTARHSGARLGVAYDMGVATDGVREAMRDVDLLILESNHDEAMLRMGPYPAMLKRRVASRHGHLSNAAAATLAREWAHRGLREVVLAHLSETNNEPALATSTVASGLARTTFRGRVTAASQREVLGPISPSGHAARAEQLALF
jgi:phosphoribosyl 1,2-cyclic phosphodiesterase